MSSTVRRVLFVLFFVSGFCSLLYQVVWVRIAFASFGIITPVLSVVISVFMLGLSAGSWAGGRLVGVLKERTRLSAIIFYAIAELLIGLSAFAVPALFNLGEEFLLASGEMDSFQYLFVSAIVLGFSILPWCVCMGATFPLGMAYVREHDVRESRSFSYLYLANVLGAMGGVFLAAVVLVELFGFGNTLRIAAAANFSIALVGFWLGRQKPSAADHPPEVVGTAAFEAAPAPMARKRLAEVILFSTGFIAIAMEVVWTRAFTPVLKTQVYSFALIVFVYLGATVSGSWLYRRALLNGSARSTAEVMALLTAAALLPVLINDPRLVQATWSHPIHVPSGILLLVSIAPFCALLGYLTPALVDQYAAGNPREAGRAYAINVLGCIVGPLFASYILLPHLSEKQALICLALPFVFFYLMLHKSLSSGWHSIAVPAGVAALVASIFFSKDFEQMLARAKPNTTVRRDYAASVISFGKSFDKQLLVNGIGMTILTPITKFMVHLPLVLHESKPKSALIICFGMGTSYRSALSWEVDTTSVELVPSVKEAFGFYHPDAAQAESHPQGRIVIDDGRRYLKRTREQYDLIVIDPAPPVEAAGASLLYSREFYELAKERLKPNGVLQAWYPRGGDAATFQAALRSICEAFPYVRGFASLGGVGAHLIASMEQIEIPGAGELAGRMPAAAQRDLLEWERSADATAYLERVLKQEFQPEAYLSPDPKIRITDDRPLNEYFLLRRALW